MTIGKIVEFIVIAFAVLILFVILLSIFDKFFKFFTFKHNVLKVQRGELIKKKMFKCSDLYELKWNGEINQKGTHVLIYIHDTCGNRTDANKMMDWFSKKDPKISVVSYDQRWFGENTVERDRNFGANLSDLKEMIYDIQDRFKQKIILVGHGFGANLAIACANEEGVSQVFAGSLKIEKGYKTSFATKMAVFWAWIFSSKSLIDYPYDAPDLSDDIEFVKELQKRRELQSSFSVREYYQTQHMLNYAIKKYNQSAADNLTILQPAKSVYARADHFAKKVTKFNNVKIEVVKESKHHLFNTTNSNDIFELIFKSITKNS
jgi:pimeloyl-ACP methyl ester carboxylesterase